MILKNLTLHNFRKFKHTSLEFPDGVIGVVGLNGVGKSTIFESIAWVLYGSVAARTSADQIKRDGAEPSDPCRVELEFVFDEEHYRVVREMTGKSHTPSASALVNGKLIAEGSEAVSTYIQRRLGMDYKSFFTSIFARQKELNVLSTMNASERRPLILRMLGIDALDGVIQTIRTDKREKDIIVENLGRTLIDEHGESKADRYAKEIENLEQKQKEIQKILKELTEKVIQSKKNMEHQEQTVLAKKREYENARLNKESLTEKKTLFEQKQKLQEDITKLQSLMKERQDTIEKQKNALKKFAHLDREVEEVEEKLQKLHRATEDVIKSIEQKKTSMENIRREIKEKEGKKKRIEQMGPDAPCPTCERILGKQYHNLVQHFTEEVQKKHEEVVTLTKVFEADEERYEKMARESQAVQKKRGFLQGQLREKGKIETTLANIVEELKRENREKEHKEKKVKEIGPVRYDPEEYTKAKEKVDDSYKNYQLSLDLLDQKKDQMIQVQLDRKEKEGENNLILQQMNILQQKKKEQEKDRKRLAEEQRSLQSLNMLSEVMNSFRTHLIARIRPTLSSYASDFFGRLTDGKYQEVELDEAYDLLIYDEGTAYNIERFSGGEEDLANLCLRLAISEVITERAGGVFNFIILDEIFGSQDTIRRQNIMNALQGLSSKFRQLFLITHIEDVKQYMEHTITVLEDEYGLSTVKIE